MEKFIKNLARGAGKILREGFRTEFKVSYKQGTWDLVTEYDLASEKYIIDRIRKKYPRHGILSEETGLIGKKDKIWVIDPLDGTLPFARGYQQFGVSIGFVSRGKVRYAAVYDPMHDELFYAKKGRGSFLNGKRIGIAKPHDLYHANIYAALGTGIATDKQRKTVFNKLLLPFGLWRAGALAAAVSLAWMAAGRLDVAITSLPLWDNCAGALLLQEAGAEVTDFGGKPWRWDKGELIAASPKLHRQIMEAVGKL
ncbi:MAG: inositol monophosphatase family protein [bacterium]|nr:inositol monophosphatase family protein [bacterium]